MTIRVSRESVVRCWLALLLAAGCASGGEAGAGAGAVAGTPDRGGAAIAERYLPAGSSSFAVTDASGFSVGDAVLVRKPVTQAWVAFRAPTGPRSSAARRSAVRYG